MSGEITARDRVWAAVVKAHKTRLDVSEVQRQIRRELPEGQDAPNDETVRRVLRSATRLGVLEHTSGSPYWHKRSELRNRWPVE